MPAAPPPAVAALALRPARPGDAAALWAIHTRAIRETCAAHYAPAEIAAWSARMTPASCRDAIRLRRVVVAEVATTEGPRVVGFGQLQPDEGVVEAVYVDPDCQRRGVGTALLAALEAAAREGGLTGLVLDASRNSVPFYAARGWRAAAPVRHELAPGVHLECTVMTRALPR